MKLQRGCYVFEPCARRPLHFLVRVLASLRYRYAQGKFLWRLGNFRDADDISRQWRAASTSSRHDEGHLRTLRTMSPDSGGVRAEPASVVIFENFNGAMSFPLARVHGAAQSNDPFIASQLGNARLAARPLDALFSFVPSPVDRRRGAVESNDSLVAVRLGRVVLGGRSRGAYARGLASD